VLAMVFALGTTVARTEYEVGAMPAGSRNVGVGGCSTGAGATAGETGTA
jgi:hypothetical protein